MTTNELIKIWAKIKQFFALKSDVNAINTTVEAIGNDLTEIYDQTSKKIKTAVLPSYVDDVIDGSYVGKKFYTKHVGSGDLIGVDTNDEITGETGKIYVDRITNNVYRWSGETYIKVSDVDLTNYYTKSQIDTKIANIPDSGMTQEQGDNRYVQKTDFGSELDSAIFSAKEVIYGFVSDNHLTFTPGSIDHSGVKSYTEEYDEFLNKSNVLYIDVEKKIAYIYDSEDFKYYPLYAELTDAEIESICVIVLEQDPNDQEAEPEG